MKSNYKIGESYPFRIKNVFANYCELIDEERGIRTYLQDTANLRLSKSQTIKCRIISTKEKHPRVELVDLSDIIVRDDANINEAVLADILAKEGISWNVRDFIKLMLAEEGYISFAQQCQRWIQQQININTNLEEIRRDCENVLEYSGFLDHCSLSERELYQNRFTTLIEQLSYYIRAQKFIAKDSDSEGPDAHQFVSEIIQKLRQSGFVYHPIKQFSILSSLFMLKPSLMDKYMPQLYAVIRSRNLNLWKKDPFRKALIHVLELYIRNGSNRIDQTKDNSQLVLQTISGLAIQLLLLERQDDGDIADYRLSAARICTIASYARLPNNVDILSLALCNLLSHNVQLPSYNLYDTRHQAFPFFVSSTAKRGNLTLDTTNIFTRNHIKLTVSKNGIELSGPENNSKMVPLLPKELNLWQNLQVYLPKSLVGVSFIGTRDIFRYERLWNDIEEALFNVSNDSMSTTSRKKHKVMDLVRISVLRQDSQDHDKFFCRIEDEIGGEGYIMLSDIVAYTAPISVRQFLSSTGNRLVFNAIIIENDDNMFHFSMEEDLKQFAQTFYKDEPDGIICSIGSDKSADGKRLPGVTQEGVSVSLVAQNGLAGLKKNTIVVATYHGEGYGTFHIEASINGQSDNNDFSITEAFHYLMQEYAIDQIEDTSSVTDRDILDSDNFMNVAEVHELIYMIDRISILDNEYVKSYNYLAFARILSLMTGMENKAAYYKGRMDIILMLHDFAVNDRVNEQNLEQLSSANVELFSGNPILRDRFNQLQTVSFIGKPEKNDLLWKATGNDDPIVSELAQLVLSYNFVKQNNMNSQAIDIHNRIKATLRLKGHETNLKLYGGGIEDKTTEYKTSIVFVADKTVDKANPQEQMKEILKVINSFLNTEGGTLYIGVNDSGMGVGLENDLEYKDFHGDRDAYQRSIISAVVKTWGRVIGTYVDITFDQDNTKAVCIVSVRPYANGIPFEGSWYVREVSTKRALTQEEFNDYNANSRMLHQQATLAESAVEEQEDNQEQPMPEEEIPQKEAKEEVREEAAPASAWEPQDTTDSIPTSVIRKNVLFEDGSDDYRPSVAFLQFLDYAKFCKISDYSWDDKLLTLAVYDEEQEGYLVIAYANGYIAKVRIDELLDYSDNQTYARYADSNVIFASIAKPGDALLCVSREDSRQRRAMLRIDSLANIPECKLSDYGNRIYNENMASEILQVDIIPSAYVDYFGELLNQDKRSLGKPTKTTKTEFRNKLQLLNVKLAE